MGNSHVRQRAVSWPSPGRISWPPTLVFLDDLRTNFSQIAEILLQSKDMHDATAAIAPLLGMDEVEALGRLNNINLFAMTRIPTEARSKKLKDLREQA